MPVRPYEAYRKIVSPKTCKDIQCLIHPESKFQTLDNIKQG